MVAQGQGKMLLADRAFDVNSYDLEEGNLTIRSGNLLAFEPTLSLKQSIIPGFLAKRELSGAALAALVG